MIKYQNCAKILTKMGPNLQINLLTLMCSSWCQLQLIKTISHTNLITIGKECVVRIQCMKTNISIIKMTKTVTNKMKMDVKQIQLN